MRLNEDQALAMGLIRKPSTPASRKLKKIVDTLRRIRESRCDVVVLPDRKKALIRVLGVTVPSLNSVMRNDMKREFYSYNKAWVSLVLDASRVARPRYLNVEPGTVVNIHVHAVRKRLLDADNICVKSIIDACAKNNLIPDDSPCYVGRVTTSQEVGNEEAVYIQMEVVPRHAAAWKPDPALERLLP